MNDIFASSVQGTTVEPRFSPGRQQEYTMINLRPLINLLLILANDIEFFDSFMHFVIDCLSCNCHNYWTRFFSGTWK